MRGYRPEFTKLLEVLQEGDTLVLTKLDRFARSTVGGINTIKELAKQREDFREGWPNKFTKNQIDHALQLLESNSYK